MAVDEGQATETKRRGCERKPEFSEQRDLRERKEWGESCGNCPRSPTSEDDLGIGDVCRRNDDAVLQCIGGVLVWHVPVHVETRCLENLVCKVGLGTYLTLHLMIHEEIDAGICKSDSSARELGEELGDVVAHL